MGFNIFVIIRILIGCIFVVSGFEKLISPHQNFLYVVQEYALFGSFLENIIAYVAPWIEFLLGIFLLLGLWLKWTLRGVLIMTAMFIVIVAQAIVRDLPIVECGCFGDFISFPLYGILIFDSVMLIMIDFLIAKEKRTIVFSLDRYFGDEK